MPGSDASTILLEATNPQPLATIQTLSGSESITVYPFEDRSYSEVTQDRLKLVGDFTYETVLHRRIQKAFFFEASEGTDGNFHWYHTSQPR